MSETGRIHGGHTPLGQELNESGQKLDSTKTSRFKTKFGIIKEVKKIAGVEVYAAIVDVLDNRGRVETTTNLIPFEADAGFLAQNYGGPKQFINQFCKIEYRGTSVNTGKIIPVGDLRLNAQQVKQANELPTKGTAFAPPGGKQI